MRSKKEIQYEIEALNEQRSYYLEGPIPKTEELVHEIDIKLNVLYWVLGKNIRIS